MLLLNVPKVVVMRLMNLCCQRDSREAADRNKKFYNKLMMIELQDKNTAATRQSMWQACRRR